jgi:hypothetical protein
MGILDIQILGYIATRDVALMTLIDWLISVKLTVLLFKLENEAYTPLTKILMVIFTPLHTTVIWTTWYATYCPAECHC